MTNVGLIRDEGQIGLRARWIMADLIQMCVMKLNNSKFNDTQLLKKNKTKQKNILQNIYSMKKAHPLSLKGR